MENPQRLAELSLIPYKRQKLSIIVGMLMGDASIVKKYPKTLVLSCGAAYRDYFDFKCSILEQLGFKGNKIRELHSKLSNGKEYLGYIRDFTNKQFEWFYNKFYKDGKRHVNLSLIRHINSFGLALWFMDDGACNTHSGTLCLHTNAFSYKEHLVLVKWFKKKFNIDVNINKEKKYFKLYFPFTSAKRLTQIILPYIHTAMKYKLRWTLKRIKSESMMIEPSLDRNIKE